MPQSKDDLVELREAILAVSVPHQGGSRSLGYYLALGIDAVHHDINRATVLADKAAEAAAEALSHSPGNDVAVEAWLAKPLGSAGDALDFALDHLDDSYDRTDFLERWREGDVDEWPGFSRWLEVQRDGGRESLTTLHKGDGAP